MAKKTTILIVEDDPALNDAYKIILGSAGHDVSTVFNGQEALDLIAKADEDPVIIFLDLRMPVLDGVGFLRKFQPTKHPKTTVIVFSNYDAHDEVDEAFRLGAHRYILKARAAPKELIKIVNSIISEREIPEDLS